jgi:hypothetical protein
MFDSWGADIEWWDDIPPREACTRFRIIYPDKHELVPRVIVDVMAALGAWRVGWDRRGLWLLRPSRAPRSPLPLAGRAFG